MNNVKVKRVELLEKLKTNLGSHKKIVEEALDGFRKEVLAELEKAIEETKSGRRVRHYISIEKPQDMSNEYQIAIAMLEMSQDEIIEISATDFRCYVLDQWQWRRQFASSNLKYLSANTQALVSQAYGQEE